MDNGEIVRFTLHYERTGASTSQNVYHGEYTGGAVTDAIFMTNLDLALDEVDGYHDKWASIASNLVECTELTASVMNLDGTVLRNLPTRIVNRIGDVLFDNMAAATSGQISFETAIPGRRGMKYIPGIADPRINLGLLDATAVSALIDLGFMALALSGAGTGVSMVLGVLSTAALAFTPFINSVSSDTNPIYQRRRGPGRGI